MFILGSIFGSFFKCVIDNYPNYHKHTRSICKHCQTQLKLLDLIPILSFIILKGRCRYCNAPLDIKYLGYEISFGLIFLAIYFLSIDNFIIMIMLICIAISDYKYGIIYDSCLLFILLTAICFKPIKLLSASIIMFIGSILSLKNLIGFGDIKLIAIFCLFLTNEQIALALLIASILAIIKERKKVIFFAPYLAIGLFVVSAI